MESQITSPHTIVSSATKWGLIHVGISIALSLVTYCVSTLLGIGSTNNVIISSVLSIGVSIFGYSISFYLMYTGIKEYKSQSNSPHFSFTSSLGWSAVFIGLFVVLYGLSQTLLTTLAMNQMDISELPEEAMGIASSPLMIIIPVLMSLFLSTIVLSGIALLVGLILKTD